MMWLRLVEDLEKFEKSGRIVSEMREYVKRFPIQGKTVIQICEDVEGRIVQLGARSAFPCNVGINDVAAHYTSPKDDKSTIPDGSIVKIDFGVEIDGCITDTAISRSLNPAYDSMIVAAETALQEALSAVAPGRKLSDIGSIIERAINRYGYKPIRNLTGHKIDRYNLHAGKSVPNVAGMEGGKFEVGEVYAIEPFATLKDAEGAVHEGSTAHIFRLARAKGAKSKSAEELIEHIQSHYKSLPFADRWIYTWREDVGDAFLELVKDRSIVGYPVLLEESGAIVSQAEHTVLVTENGCSVLTV
jgi:methionyl aminopeptidase